MPQSLELKFFPAAIFLASLLLLGGCTSESVRQKENLSSASCQSRSDAGNRSARVKVDEVVTSGDSSKSEPGGQRKFSDFVNEDRERTRGEPAWRLTFDEYRFGRCVGLVTAKRIIFKDGVIFRLMLPPYTEAVVFSTENERYFTPSLYTYKQQTELIFKGLTIKPAGNEKLFGLDCKRYRYFDRHNHEKGSFLTTKTIGVVPKLADECSYMSFIPGGYGFPIELTVVEKEGKRVNHLRPLKVEKTKATDEDFQLPYGFKRARDLFELEFVDKSSTYSDAMNDLFRTSPDSQ